MTDGQGHRANFHEDLKREVEVQIGSNRAFGLVMAGVCFLIASIGFWKGTSHWPYWLTGGSAFLLCALLRPELLSPLNRLWFRLGLLMHKVVNPLVMGLVFFVVVTPMGLLMRAFGNRPLSLEPDPDTRTYWTARASQSRPTTDQY
jgi:hypothetical protein